MKKIINGEVHTRDSIIEAHARLVYWQCNKLRRYAKKVGHDYDDIVSVGFMALLDAFDRYDGSTNNTRFSTFAVPTIWGKIQSYLRKSNVGIYYPNHIKETAEKIKKYELEDSPIDEIIEKADINPNYIQFALGYLQNGTALSLDQPLEQKDGQVSIADAVGESDDSSGIFVEEFLRVLTDSERSAVVGLMEGKTLVELGAESGVSRTSIWMAKERAKQKYLEFSGGGIR